LDVEDSAREVCQIDELLRARLCGLDIKMNFSASSQVIPWHQLLKEFRTEKCRAKNIYGLLLPRCGYFLMHNSNVSVFHFSLIAFE